MCYNLDDIKPIDLCFCEGLDTIPASPCTKIKAIASKLTEFSHLTALVSSTRVLINTRIICCSFLISHGLGPFRDYRSLFFRQRNTLTPRNGFNSRPNVRHQLPIGTKQAQVHRHLEFHRPKIELRTAPNQASPSYQRPCLRRNRITRSCTKYGPRTQHEASSGIRR